MSDQFDAASNKSREISTIAFPYFDLEEAISVAKALHAFGGGVPLDRDQVATAVDSAGGTLANKLSAAKQFGVVESAQGKWSLTPLGYDIIDPVRSPAAKAEAFLNVELYKRTFDAYRGNMLPGPAGLEHAFTTFGVAVKQKQKARQTFERSARVAGYFPNGKEDRLVRPVVSASSDLPPAENQELLNAVTLATPSSPPAAPPRPAGLNPFIEGLLSELPPAKSDWSIEDRAKWLQAAAQIFDLIYSGGQGRITIMADG